MRGTPLCYAFQLPSAPFVKSQGKDAKAIIGNEDSRDWDMKTIGGARRVPRTVKELRIMGSLVAAVAVTGCQTDAQLLAREQETATQTALRRGQFELDCPQATGTILSSNLLQWGAWGNYLQAEYTVGVAGCGQRRTYIVICRLSDSSCSTLPNR